MSFPMDIQRSSALQDACPFIGPQILHHAVQAAPVMVFLNREDGRIAYVNQEASTTLGYSREELLSMTIPDLVEDFDIQSFRAHVGDLAKVDAMTFEAIHLAKDGRRIPVEVRTILMEVNGERMTCAYATDITRRKQVEQELRRSQRMDSLGQLASGIAHDLKNMLSPVLLGAQLMETDAPSPEKQRLACNMANQIKRCNAFLNQLMTFARGSAGHRERLALVPLIEETLALCTSSFPRNIEIRTSLPSGLPEVVGNPTQLEQVMMNLLVNARDAMPEGGCLEVELGTELASDGHSCLSLQVRDTGIGIPEELRERIFEPFVTTKPAGRGTGLGLSTTIGIIRSHGGRIEVESQPGQGSCFTVLLPSAS
nr:ATP-binding protein [uncultured Holophaga sp.]